MNYTKLRKDSRKDKTPFILYAFQGATVNFTVKKNTAKDDDEDVDEDIIDDDSTDSTTSTTTGTTTAPATEGGLTWDNIFDDWNIAPATTGTTSTVATSSAVGTATGPRGRRNNNWGNIRLTNTNWRGKVNGTDTAFETFDTAENGVRAAAKQIITYITRDGIDTITGIINKWAPSNENNTTGYIQRVAQMTGYSPNEKIAATDSEKIKNILKAIFTVELGQDLTSDDLAVIDRGVASV